MSNPNYTLEIISHHSKFNNKVLRKYYVDGIETVGAWGDEPFEIRFKNNTWQKVQVKLSVDGTDIMTGALADTQVSKDMWVVNGYATLSLKAWPETNNGGASFVFTSGTNSVAVHTHGDLSNRGIIAAAVFTEGHVEPIKITPPARVEEHHHHHYDTWPYYQPLVYLLTNPIWVYTNNNSTGGNYGRGSSLGGTYTKSTSAMPAASGGGTYTSSLGSAPNGFGDLGGTYDSMSFCADIGDGEAAAGSLEELVSVGAGEHVDQKITYVAGLIKPVFSETVRVKYVWWDDLVAKLRTQTVAQAQPSGFPGDAKQKNIDLRGTPRIGKVRRAEETFQQMYDRF